MKRDWAGTVNVLTMPVPSSRMKVTFRLNGFVLEFATRKYVSNCRPLASRPSSAPSANPQPRASAVTPGELCASTQTPPGPQYIARSAMMGAVLSIFTENAASSRPAILSTQMFSRLVGMSG